MTRTFALLGAVALTPLLTTSAVADGAPAPAAGFKLSTFATPPAGLSKPDSLAVINDQIWIGYGNEGKKDGAENAMSAIVEYAMDGKVLKTLTLKGHNDAVKLDPKSGKVWAMHNEDGNASLDVIDPASDAMEHYEFGEAKHGGGFDDVVFMDGVAYVTASAPSTDGGKKNPGASIMKATLGADHKVKVEDVLSGTPDVTDMVTGKTETLNLTDPDSITSSPDGGMVMTSQDDGEILFVKSGKARVLHLAGGVKVDDTTFVDAGKGFLLVADTPANIVYKIEADNWDAGAAYSAMSGVDAVDKAPAIAGYVGKLDMKTGALVPVVDAMKAPHGLIFVGAK